ncbi:MAG TPA: hypothetical protein VFZ48_00440 [Candidatus Saccharimonadales bacterium]
MFQKIHVFKFVVYSIVTLSILVNAALVFGDTYTPANRELSVSIFILVIILFVTVPAFYLGKTGWLKR